MGRNGDGCRRRGRENERHRGNELEPRPAPVNRPQANRADVAAADFADPTKREAWIRDEGAVVFQLHSERHRETRIDLFVSEPFEFDLEYGRAKAGELLPGVPARFVRVETLIEMKEAAGREKNLEDARQLRLLMEHPDGER